MRVIFEIPDWKDYMDFEKWYSLAFGSRGESHEEKGFPVCIVPCVLYSTPVSVSCCCCAERLQKWGRWNGDQGMENAVFHDQLSILNVLLETLPTQLILHGCEVACSAVVTADTSTCPSLHSFQYVYFSQCVRTPYIGRVSTWCFL